jgi:chromosome segregation ATPase
MTRLPKDERLSQDYSDLKVKYVRLKAELAAISENHKEEIRKIKTYFSEQATEYGKMKSYIDHIDHEREKDTIPKEKHSLEYRLYKQEMKANNYLKSMNEARCQLGLLKKRVLEIKETHGIDIPKELLFIFNP